MLAVLRNQQFRRLYSAQILSLLGTGLMTVGLALVAYELTGADAGIVMGTVLAIKMVAYVGFAPIASALSARVPFKPFLVGLDVLRFSFVAFLPFVTAVWQIYLIVFIFQLCSAAFTPTFQSVIPDVLPDEEEYTSALSLSRLAYDMESLLSPLVAGLLLGLMDARLLFIGTALGFLASAAFVLSARLPERGTVKTARSFLDRLSRGFRIYARTPRLRALFALGMAVSFTAAWVIVNSVVFARETLGGTQQTYTTMLAFYGAGSMVAAISMRALLQRVSPRLSMGAGALLLGLAPWTILIGLPFAGVLALWFVLGASAALVLTPSGLLIARSTQSEDRPALFATQFSLSHAGWLATYPLAGYLGAHLGLELSFAVMACGALASGLIALTIWPAHDPVEREHTHMEMHHNHMHVHDEHHDHEHEGWEGPEPHAHPHRHAPLRHRHAFAIDDHHPVWNM